MNTVYLILREDIMLYPPVLSIIDILLQENKYKIVHIGVYSDSEGKKKLEQQGVVFVSTIKYKAKANPVVKLYQQFKYRKQVENYLQNAHLNSDDVIWIFQAETVALLYNLVKKYKTIIHPFEYVDIPIKWKYRLVSPLYNPRKVFNSAYKVVCCEYNRAHILKGLLQLDKLPNILPNKPFDISVEGLDIPRDIKLIVDELARKTYDKKVVLYQGIFLDRERRLEEFCQAIQSMPDDYVFIAMGLGSDLYDKLKSKYESNKIIFIPFIRPPYHLLITKLAKIGVLSYFPRPDSIGAVLNPLYCAPNKIFEYAKFGIPMISNDVPALHYTYLEFDCGICLSYPIDVNNIRNAIEALFAEYNRYSRGALKYYQSVDMKKNIIDILS